MTSIQGTAEGIPPGVGLLDRERIIARPGFNRWLVPPAALGNPSVHRHGLWLQRVLAAAVARHRHRQIGRLPSRHRSLSRRCSSPHCDWKISDLGWMFTLFFVLLGSSAAIWGGWLETCRAAQGRRRGRAVLVRRPADLGARRLYPSDLADVAGLRRDRRHRPRPGLHLAGLDPDQMVSRPARHGDRHGHHGLWRRRHDRRAAGRHADEHLPHAHLGRRLADLRGDGGDLFRLHDGRRPRLSRAADGWRPDGWTPPARERQVDDHQRITCICDDAHKTPQFWLLWGVLC